MSKQTYYEREIEAVMRTEQWAIGVKNASVEVEPLKPKP